MRHIVIGMVLVAGLGGCSSPSAAPTDPKSPKDRADFAKGVDDEDALEQFRELQKDWEKSPEDFEAQAGYISGLIYIGILQNEQKRPEPAAACRREAQKLLDSLVARKDLEVEQLDMLGRLYYVTARAQ